MNRGDVDKRIIYKKIILNLKEKYSKLSDEDKRKITMIVTGEIPINKIKIKQ